MIQLLRHKDNFVANTTCFDYYREYLIMGHEDFNKTELLLRKDSYVVPWSDPIQRDYGEVRQSRDEH